MFFINPKDAPTWLDDYSVEPEPDPNWKPWVPPERGIRRESEPRPDGSYWSHVWTSQGKCHQFFFAGGGADAKSLEKELWRQLDRIDPLTA